MIIETLKRIFTPSKSSERAENTNPNIPNKQPEKKPEILCFKNCATLTTQDLISFLHPNLQILDLTGSLIDYIPPEIEQCQQLKELYLSSSKDPKPRKTRLAIRFSLPISPSGKTSYFRV